MKLYKVTVSRENCISADYMVLSDNETQASKYVMSKYKEWDYSTFCYVSNIKLIAEEGQYGEPVVLLNAMGQIL